MVFKIVLDVLALGAVWVISFYLRFPDNHLLETLYPHLSYIPIWIISQIFSFVIFRRYSAIWRFSGLKDLEQLVKASLFGVLIIASIIYFIPTYNLPRSVLMIVFMLTVLCNGGIRILIRKIVNPLTHYRKSSNVRQRILIYGAGQAGELLMRNILQTPQVGWDVVGFIDDDPRKKGKFIHLKPVFGGRSQVPYIVRTYHINIILFSIPSLSGKEIREIIYSLRSMLDKSIEIKIMPGLADV
ncbi:MAG: nucleoside-diphosphate sugar epimerase/dehydratase, partial [bacterium]